MEIPDFPGNSRNKPSEPAEKPKKVERIVSGEVSRRKPTLGKRLKEMFVGGDAQSVGSYVFGDILIPAVKDTIADMISQGIERMLFGEARSSSRRTGSRPSTSPGYVSYNRFSSGPAWKKDDRREESRPMSSRARASHDFQDILLEKRVEAEAVLDNLFNLVQMYEQATVADLYDLVGISPSFTDERWGWTDLRGSGVTRTRDGYLLALPRPEPLSE